MDIESFVSKSRGFLMEKLYNKTALEIYLVPSQITGAHADSKKRHKKRSFVECEKDKCRQDC